MSTTPQPAADAAAPTAAPAYTTVQVSRTVEVMGFFYKPGVTHHVDAATLAALGDAVVLPAQPGA